MTASGSSFDDGPFWGVIQLMGHVRFAGLMRKASVLGAPAIRVDVPDSGEGYPGFTKFVAPGSLYDVTPTTEETAREMAARIRATALDPYDIRAVARTMAVGMVNTPSVAALAAPVEPVDEDDGMPF